MEVHPVVVGGSIRIGLRSLVKDVDFDDAIGVFAIRDLPSTFMDAASREIPLEPSTMPVTRKGWLQLSASQYRRAERAVQLANASGFDFWTIAKKPAGHDWEPMFPGDRPGFSGDLLDLAMGA